MAAPDRISAQAGREDALGRVPEASDRRGRAGGVWNTLLRRGRGAAQADGNTGNSGNKRWHRHGMIRPSVAGTLALAACGLLWYAALLLDDPAVVAGALAVSALWIIALATAVAQYAAMRADTAFAVARVHDGVCSIPVAAGAARAVLPSLVSISRQFEQRDQDGRVIGRCAGALPQGRGWYCDVAIAVRWHEPFGLFAVRRMLARTRQTAVLAKPETGAPSSMTAPDTRLHSRSQPDGLSGVREYIPGDSPRLISWHHSAHHGTLMTKEGDANRQMTTVVVLDTRTRGVTDEQVDAEVAKALPLFGANHGGGHDLVLCDGVHTATGSPDILRLLAASRALGGGEQDDGGRPDAHTWPPKPVRSVAALPGDGRSNTAGMLRDGAGSGPAETEASSGRHDPVRLARTIAGVASQGQRRARVMLFTPRPQGGLAQELRMAMPHEDLHVIAVSAKSDDTSRSQDAEYEHIDVTPPARSPHSPAPAPGRGRTNAPSGGHHPQSARTSQHMHHARLDIRADDSAAYAERTPDDGGRVSTRNVSCHAARALVLIILLELALQSLTVMFTGDGYWLWFARIGCVVLAIESSIPWNRPVLGVARALAASLAVIAAAVPLAILRVHDVAQVWLFDMPTLQVSGDATANAVGARASAWLALEQTMTTGFDDLIAQRPPVQVSVSGDLSLLMVVVAVLVGVRCLMMPWRGMLPVFALAPLAVFLSNGMLLGIETPWWQVALLVLVFAFSVHLAFGRYPLPVAVLAASLLATALVLMTTAPALSLAQRVPLSIGNSTGLLSSSTINPMIDLKRSLQTGSDGVVLRYRADKRLYLRMTTLDAFDGDTWSFDNRLALDGGFYGSGFQLGLDDGDTLSARDRLRGQIDPLAWYVSALGYDGNANGNRSGGVGASSSEFVSEARVQIDALDSRFLPVPGTPMYLSGDANGWLGYRDGTVYSRDSATSQGMRYTAYGLYVDPITSAQGFDQIDQIESLRDSLVADPALGDDAARQGIEARSYVEQQLKREEAQIHRQFRELPDDLPEQVNAMVNAAQASGVPTEGNTADDQVEAMRYLVRYFTTPSNGFTYSLDAPDGNGRGNMEVINDFLVSKAGYCVHYASALAVLGRAMGVPTRMVLGYNKGAGGADDGGEFTVAAKQLHAWVEAYIDGVGWMPFDVTPATSENNSAVDAGSADGTAQATDSASPSDTERPSDSAHSEPTPSASSSSTGRQNDNADARDARDGAHLGFSMPGWGWIVLWTLLAMATAVALIGAPSLIRTRRRRRRLHAIGASTHQPADPDLSARAWLAAWEELCDTAWDAGVRWSSSDTEHAIAARISGWMLDPHIPDEPESGVPSIPTHHAVDDADSPEVVSSGHGPYGATGAPTRSQDEREMIARIADVASGSVFGSVQAPSVGDLGERLDMLLKRMRRIALRRHRAKAIRALLVPPSLSSRPR